MWILHIFAASPGWISGSELAGVYRRSVSEATRRYAALAIATCGTRAEALAIREDMAAAPGLLRLAILAASTKLGSDERKHWRLANPPVGVLEKYM